MATTAFKYGNTVFPIQNSSPTLLTSCDPSLAKILDYLSTMITAYAGEALLSLGEIRATDNQAMPLQRAVAMVAPIEPDTIAKVEQFQFPLVCAWRKSAKYEERTANWISDVTKLGFAYILPPLTGHQSIIYTPFLNSVAQLCNYALNTGHDVAYNNDERIALNNNISRLRLLTGTFGSYDFAGKGLPPYWPAWVAEIELTEQQTPYVVGIPSLTGTDFTVTQQEKETSTVITADAALAATSIQVGSTAGIGPKDVLVIGLGTARQELVTVDSVTDVTHLALQSGLAFAHTAAQGDAVQTPPLTMIQARTDVG